MVELLSQVGMLPEATKFISKMPIEPNAKVWGTLLNEQFLVMLIVIPGFLRTRQILGA